MFDATSAAADRAEFAGRAANNRAAVSNGSRLLAGIDGRSADARRYRDVAFALADNLGGDDKLSEAERALIRQAAANIVASERLQGAMIRGEPVDLEQATRLANVTSRLLSRLGIKRRVQEPPRLADALRGGR